MKIFLAVVVTVLVQSWLIVSASAQTNANQLFLPVVFHHPVTRSEPLDYVAEAPVAHRPVEATLQVDVFDQCGACGANHRLRDVVVEMVYIKDSATYTITRVTDQEGVVKLYEPYDSLTLRIVADPTRSRVTSSVVTVSRLQQDPTGVAIAKWGITFKRRW